MQPVTLYTSITELPLSKFIACMYRQDLAVLVITGEPAPADLLEAWSNLYAQYVDLMKDAESEFVMRLQLEVGLLSFRIGTIDSIVQVLTVIHDQQLVDALKAFGCDTSKLVPSNRKYRHELEKISARQARYRLKLADKMKELEQYQEGRQGDNVDENYFVKLLARLSKYQGYALRAHELMTAEFAAIFREYLTHLKSKTSVSDGKARED